MVTNVDTSLLKKDTETTAESRPNPNQTLPPEQIEYEDVVKLIKEGTRYQDELRVKLKDIKVPVTVRHPHVLNSIRNIFGDDYIKDGKAYITFDMVVECMALIRSVGQATASEL